MNKKTNQFIVFGGAGYLGGHVVKELASNPENKVTIITRNKSKKILFKEFKNIDFSSNVRDVLNQKIYVINLAYGLDLSYKKTKDLNNSILNSIDELCCSNKVISLIHLSSIVLSENDSTLEPKLNKSDTYKYAKSFVELGVKKIHQKHNIPTLIIRSGNIIGPGSIWVVKICKNLLDDKPIATKTPLFYSNATYVGNLVSFIVEKSKKASCSFKTINFNEFGLRPWNDFIQIISDEIGLKPKKWKSSSMDEFKVSFKKDIRNAVKEMIKVAVLKIYKGPASNKFVDKTLEALNIKNLDLKAKTNIKKIDNDAYPDSQEYSLLKVFMNKDKIENSLDQKEIEALPYDFKKLSNEIVNWLKLSGYSSIKIK